MKTHWKRHFFWSPFKHQEFLIHFDHLDNLLWSGQGSSQSCQGSAQARLWTRDLGQATSGQGSGPSHKDLGSSRLLKMNCRWKNVPKWKKSTFRSRSLSSIGAKLTKLQLFFNFTTSNRGPKRRFWKSVFWNSAITSEAVYTIAPSVLRALRVHSG